MGTIPGTVLALLTKQYYHELANSIRYEMRSAWADYRGLDGTAEFFAKEAEGERGHAAKVLAYIKDRNQALAAGVVDTGENADYLSFNQLFETANEFELLTTAMLEAIHAEAELAGDTLTCQWLYDSDGLLKEQVEEENLYRTILDRIEQRGFDQASIHDIDIWLKSLGA